MVTWSFLGFQRSYCQVWQVHIQKWDLKPRSSVNTVIQIQVQLQPWNPHNNFYLNTTLSHILNILYRYKKQHLHVMRGNLVLSSVNKAEVWEHEHASPCYCIYFYILHSCRAKIFSLIYIRHLWASLMPGPYKCVGSWLCGRPQTFHKRFWCKRRRHK